MSPAATTALWEVAPEPDPAPPPEGFYLQTDLGHITNFVARANSGREHGRELQGMAKRWAQGLVNFVAAVAYHFCLALPAAFVHAT